MNIGKTAICVTLSLAVSSVGAATINVPADQLTIQAGIDSAGVGDTVMVANGTYTGDGNRDIDFGGKSLVLKSKNGPRNTVIACEGSAGDFHRGFYFESGEDTSSIVDGFTISGAYHPNGGGVWCKGSSPKFKNCVFADNIGLLSGGAVRCKSASPVFENCTFVFNHSDNVGSAVYCMASSSPRLQNCIIAFGTGGEAVYCQDVASQPSLSCCDVYGNEGGDWVDCIEEQFASNGNFSLAPLFCDTATGNFFLTSNSPCLPQNNSCAVVIGAFGTDCIQTDVNDHSAEFPDRYSLSQNHPNPFNPATTIEYSVKRRVHVTLSIFNLLGQRVRTLVDEVKSAGQYQAVWDGKGKNGREQATGVYLYRLEILDNVEQRKMLLLK